MKFVVFTWVVLTSFGAYSQENAKIERVWLSFNHGLNHYNESSLHFQCLKNLSFGGSYQLFRLPHGPIYSESTSAITSRKFQAKDDHSDVTLFIGFTSEAPHKSFLTVGIGPSFGKSSVYSNIEIKKMSTGRNYFEFDLEENRRVGFAYRASFNISVHPNIGLNFGVVGNFNKIQTYHRFIFGLNFGLLSSSQ